MGLRVLFVADPMDRLKPLGDTTLAFVREGLRRGWEIFWATGETVTYVLDHVEALASPVLGCPPDALGRLGAEATWRIDAFDAVFIRKDPPFDAGYVKLCWLLALEEPRV